MYNRKLYRISPRLYGITVHIRLLYRNSQYCPGLGILEHLFSAFTIIFQFPIGVVVPNNKGSSAKDGQQDEAELHFPLDTDIGKPVSDIPIIVVYNGFNHYCATKPIKPTFKDGVKDLFPSFLMPEYCVINWEEELKILLLSKSSPKHQKIAKLQCILWIN